MWDRRFVPLLLTPESFLLRSCRPAVCCLQLSVLSLFLSMLGSLTLPVAHFYLISLRHDCQVLCLFQSTSRFLAILWKQDLTDLEVNHSDFWVSHFGCLECFALGQAKFNCLAAFPSGAYGLGSLRNLMSLSGLFVWEEIQDFLAV
jgi:hypothetical protein